MAARSGLATLLLAASAAGVPLAAQSDPAADRPERDVSAETRDAAEGTRPGAIRPEDLHALREVSDVALSPDGRWVAYSVSSYGGPGRAVDSLWIADLGSGERAFAGLGGSQLAWSPGGERLAFMGERDGESGLLVVSATGGDPRLLAETLGTNRPLPSMGRRLSWSPDGEAIVYVSAVEHAEEDSVSEDPRVVTRYLYKPNARTGDTRFADARRLHLFVVDVGTGESTQLTDGRFDEHSVHWSPRGDEILFVSNREPEPDRFFNYDVFSLDVESGVVRRLTATESAEYNPSWSPDGASVAYQGTTRGLTSSETTMEDTHVWVMAADGSGARDVGGVDNRQGPPAWSADGRRLYFTVQERGDIHLYRVDAGGGSPERVVGGRGRVGSWSLGGSGRLAYAFTGTEGPGDLWVRDGAADAGSARRLTELNRPLLTDREVAPVSSFTFRSYDGVEVEAFLTLPLGLDTAAARAAGPGGRAGDAADDPGAQTDLAAPGGDGTHPLIVMIKGGPHSQQGAVFNEKAQVYAGRGWAVLMINYRGSTGYGQSFADAIFRDQNGGEAFDVLYGTRAALRRYPWIDRDRVGIEGGSYGGQLTNWLVTQTDLYAAAIPIAGISNLVSFNYMAYYHDYLAVEYGAWPHQGEIMDMLWRRSPLRFVAQVRTPVMLVHGENDNDVPIAEAEQFYIALKDVGVEAIMLRYPREGHGIRETGHRVDLIRRSVDWYRRHFGLSEDPARPGGVTDANPS